MGYERRGVGKEPTLPMQEAPQPQGPQQAQMLGTPGSTSGLTLHLPSHITKTDVISLFAAGKY